MLVGLPEFNHRNGRGVLYGELPGCGRLTGYAKTTRRNDHDTLYLSFTDADDYTDWAMCHSGNLVEWVVSVTEAQPA